MVINKKGFVLMEAIVVISVLCVILVVLYASYSKLLIDVQKKSLYDNTEYIYKTNAVRDYFELSDSLMNNRNITTCTSSNTVNIYCSNTISGVNNCYNEGDNSLFAKMLVQGVYFAKWNLDYTNFNNLEATTQKYIRAQDPKYISGIQPCRIIVMYRSENSTNPNDYEYATLRFGSRG